MKKIYSRKCFIRCTGKNELKIFHLIDYSNFEMLDIFFSTQKDAISYANKNSIDIVHYQDTNNETNNSESILA